MRTRFMVSCAAGALLSGLAGGAAFAADATVADTGPSAIQEVVVTAQRREETVQTVPMTVQALSSDAIAKLNITNVEQILRFTPNVVYSAPGAGQGQLSMRGLSTGRAGEQSYATVGNFPNVAVYLDEQSMQFPGRTPDIYLADMQRVEILEGPQGTLFGGGAEAGAVRYITNKPRLNVFEGNVEGMYGYTEHGDNNWSFNAAANLPLVQDKLAARVVVYNDRQGGYIDNVPSTFTRNEQLDSNTYIGVKPTGGVCPDGGKPNSGTGFCLPLNSPQANNFALAGKDQNPVTIQGARVSLLWQVNPDWDLLISQSVQNLDAEGLSTTYPVGSDFQPLKPLQVTTFVPTYNKDNYESTAWTLNGKFAGGFSAIYTGGYTDRHITQQNDYTNYSRTLYGQYYECTGGNNSGFGAGKSSGPVVPARCYSPVTFWHDKVHNTHMSHEARVSSPSDWRIRGIAGVFYEQYRIYDVMDFNYKTIPSCQNPAILAAALAPGGAPCVGNDAPAPGSTQNDPAIRGDMVGYGDDVTRGYDQTALFAQFDADIIPKVLTVTAGVRHYSYDEFEKGSIYHTATNCTDVLVCPPKANIDAEHLSVNYSGFKSHFGIQYKPMKDLMFYVTYSEGFRPGGFNRYSENKAPLTNGNNQFAKPVAYAPDSLKNYEGGVKSELFDHRLQLNITGYYMEWLNSQIALYQPCCLGNSTFTTNGASYSVTGVEASFIARVTEGLTVQGSASYNDNKQINSPCLVSNLAGSPTLGQCITQVKGQPYPNPFGVKGGISAFSPKFQGNLRARYEWNMGEYKPWVSIDGNYTSEQFNEPENYISGNDPSQIVPSTTYLRYRIPGYGTVGGSLGFTRDKWTVEVVGQNLLDSHANTLSSSGQFIRADVPLRPRVVNLKVGMRF